MLFVSVDFWQIRYNDGYHFFDVVKECLLAGKNVDGYLCLG